MVPLRSSAWRGSGSVDKQRGLLRMHCWSQGPGWSKPDKEVVELPVPDLPPHNLASQLKVSIGMNILLSSGLILNVHYMLDSG